MMRFLLISILFFLFTSLYCQTKKVRYAYGNGSKMALGEIITCPGYNKNYIYGDSSDKCRKIGKWVYYYQSGIMERIENYKQILNCNSKAIRDGIWKYYNEKGLIVKEEEYKDGKLWNAEVSKFYFKKELAGEIKIINGVLNTLKYIDVDSLNLIKNGNFKLYFGQPQLNIGNGQNRIEDQIPFWMTPNKSTPDYYNQYRRLSKVPDNYSHEYNVDYNYVGVILYHEPIGNYSEYLTGALNKTLQPNRKYLVKIRIRLSQNSGYCIDKVGILFSNTIPILPNIKEDQKDKPQILFNKIIDNRDDWVTLCGVYIGQGDEKYMTIGRFNGLATTTINQMNPLNQSEGEYNKSAYYLIDKIELLDDTINYGCNNNETNLLSFDRMGFDLLNPKDSLTFNKGKTFILKNVYFDFDKSTLQPSSFIELDKLLSFLKKNSCSITIMGHTDNIGSEDYNYDLSLLRAKAIVDWLIEKGIDAKRLNSEGYGAKIPIIDNNSDLNRAINRRVEFKIVYQ